MRLSFFKFISLCVLSITIQACFQCHNEPSTKNIAAQQNKLLNSISDPAVRNKARELLKNNKIQTTNDLLNKTFYPISKSQEQVIAEFTALFKLGVHVNNYWCNQTVLSEALSIGKEKIADFLLNQPKINVNLIDKSQGRAPIHDAVLNCSPQIVKKLLEKGPQVNIYIQKDMSNLFPGHEQQTALHFLLNAPIIPKAAKVLNKESIICGDEAYLEERKQILTMLLHYPGIDVTKRDKAGKTPLEYAKEQYQAMKSSAYRQDPLQSQKQAFYQWACQQLEKFSKPQ